MNTRNLLTDETVVYEGKLHWRLFLLPGLFLLLATAGGIWLLTLKHAVAAGVLFLAGIIFFLPALLRYATNGLVLTTKRVISNRGVISRRSIDIALRKIEGVSVDQTLLGQLFNFGTVVIRGTGGGLEQFPLLGHPAEFSKALHQQIETKL